MNYQPVTPPHRWRWRRWWRIACRVTSVAGLVVLWLAGIVLPARELMSGPPVAWTRTAGSVAVVAVLWTAGLALVLGQPQRRGSG